MKVVPNPTRRGGLRAVALGVTDRALRYRANRNAPPEPKRCAYCGSGRNVEVEHVDGHEEHSNPENLLWACRSCNTKKGAYFARAKRGRKTRQYNPDAGEGARTYAQWISAVLSLKGEGDMSIDDAVAIVHATPVDRRARFQRQLWSVRRQKYGPSGRQQQEEVPF